MKKIICALLIVSIFLCLAGCGKTKTLHCDSCNTEITVNENSKVEEDWAIYCESCEEAIMGDNTILDEN